MHDTHQEPIGAENIELLTKLGDQIENFIHRYGQEIRVQRQFVHRDKGGEKQEWDIQANIGEHAVGMDFAGSGREIQVAFWYQDPSKPLDMVNERMGSSTLKLAHFIKQLVQYLVNELHLRVVCDPADDRRYEVYRDLVKRLGLSSNVIVHDPGENRI